MKSFKDFDIKAESSGLVGERIKISKILNKPIVVSSFQIKDSTQNDGKCLYLQIELDGEQRVVFTGSKGLQGMIQKVPADSFPFQTTIIISCI